MAKFVKLLSCNPMVQIELQMHEVNYIHGLLKLQYPVDPKAQMLSKNFEQISDDINEAVNNSATGSMITSDLLATLVRSNVNRVKEILGEIPK